LGASVRAIQEESRTVPMWITASAVVPVGPGRFAQVQLQPQARVQAGKARQQRRNVLAAVAERRGDAQRAGEALVVALQRFAQAVELRQQRGGLAGEAFALGVRLSRRACAWPAPGPAWPPACAGASTVRAASR
jgi:hypothetical protein